MTYGGIFLRDCTACAQLLLPSQCLRTLLIGPGGYESATLAGGALNLLLALTNLEIIAWELLTPWLPFDNGCKCVSVVCFVVLPFCWCVRTASFMRSRARDRYTGSKALCLFVALNSVASHEHLLLVYLLFFLLLAISLGTHTHTLVNLRTIRTVVKVHHDLSVDEAMRLIVAAWNWL